MYKNDEIDFSTIIGGTMITATVIGLGFVAFMLSPTGAHYLCEDSLFKAFWQTQYYMWP